MAAFLSLTKDINAAGLGTGTVLSEGGAVKFCARAATLPSSIAQSTIIACAPRRPGRARFSYGLVWLGVIIGPWIRIGLDSVSNYADGRGVRRGTCVPSPMGRVCDNPPRAGRCGS